MDGPKTIYTDEALYLRWLYGSNCTAFAARPGPWSDPKTWAGHVVPGLTDSVYVPGPDNPETSAGGKRLNPAAWLESVHAHRLREEVDVVCEGPLGRVSHGRIS